jgi:predicted transcriptional regulator
MVIDLGPEKEARLAEVASQRGVETDELVRHVLLRYLEDDQRFIAAVNVGLTAADRGDLVAHDEVWAKVESILQEP